MRWPTVQRLGLITAVCSLKHADNDGQRGGFDCREMLNLTQAHSVHVKTHTVADGKWKERELTLRLSEKEIHICLISPSCRQVLEVKKQSACVLRWKPARSEVIYLSFFLWPSPSSHIHSKSFLKLTSSC